MNRNYFGILLVVSISLLTFSIAGAHCEIPFGIYDDEARIQMIAEHITTIEKSMKQILDLQSDKLINYNQLIRCVVNKENHANALQEIVTQYFMTQRIKFDMKDYDKKLVLLHRMLVYAMKCKQTVDPYHVMKLRALLKEFRELYFSDSHD